MNLIYEQRSGETANLDGKTVEGYAAVFGSRAMIGPGEYETIARGAFSEALKTDDIFLTLEHDPGRILARTKSGTLQLKQDSRGLAVMATLPDTTLGNDTAELMRRGDLSNMSFRFHSPKVSWKQLEDGSELRTLHSMHLVDTSLVMIGAYPDATASIRSRDLASGIVETLVPVRILRTHRLLSLKENI